MWTAVHSAFSPLVQYFPITDMIRIYVEEEAILTVIITVYITWKHNSGVVFVLSDTNFRKYWIDFDQLWTGYL